MTALSESFYLKTPFLGRSRPHCSLVGSENPFLTAITFSPCDEAAPVRSDHPWPSLAVKHQSNNRLVGPFAHFQNRPLISIAIIGLGQGMLHRRPAPRGYHI